MAQQHISKAPYGAMTGAMLVGITFAVGAVFGLVFAFIWNWLAGAGNAGQPARRTARSKA